MTGDRHPEKLQTEPDKLQTSPDTQISQSSLESEKILCPHCQRTATNGIKCKGICVSDHDY